MCLAGVSLNDFICMSCREKCWCAVSAVVASFWVRTNYEENPSEMLVESSKVEKSKRKAKKRQINYSANRLMTPYRVLFIKVNLPHFHNYLHSIFHICGETSIEERDDS